MTLETLFSQPIRWGTQQKVPCYVLKMGFIYLCPRACLQHWCFSTCLLPLIQLSIDHDTLLSCLSVWFGFAGSELKWFGSYFQDRFQSVKIGSAVSDLFKLKFGVPQGSVLGPLLFFLYKTPLSQVIRKYTGVKYHFYADDTQLFVHLSPEDSLKSLDRLKSCLNDIHVWMSENKL